MHAGRPLSHFQSCAGKWLQPGHAYGCAPIVSHTLCAAAHKIRPDSATLTRIFKLFLGKHGCHCLQEHHSQCQSDRRAFTGWPTSPIPQHACTRSRTYGTKETAGRCNKHGQLGHASTRRLHLETSGMTPAHLRHESHKKHKRQHSVACLYRMASRAGHVYGAVIHRLCRILCQP